MTWNTRAKALTLYTLFVWAPLTACARPFDEAPTRERGAPEPVEVGAAVADDDDPLMANAEACPPPPPPVDEEQCEAWTSAGAPFPLPGRLAVTFAPDPSLPEDHEIGVLDLAEARARAGEARDPMSPNTVIRRLTHNNLQPGTKVNESEIDVSADGTKIVYTVRPELDGFGEGFEIRQIGIDGGPEEKLIPPDPGFPYGGGPVFWHDGTNRVLFARNDLGRPVELLTFNPAAPAAEPFATGGGPHDATLALLLDSRTSEFGDPEVSYDGSMITFKGSLPSDKVTGKTPPQPSIYVYNLHTRKLRRLTRCYSDHDPVFSRDGKKIYFERYHGPGHWFLEGEHTAPDGTEIDEYGDPIGSWRFRWSIVEVDIATRKERVIVPHDPCGRMLPWLPTVSPDPDGRYLMYTVNDITAWADEGRLIRPMGEAWVTDLASPNLARQKVPGSEWVHFIDWTR